MEELLNTSEVAALLGVAPITIRKWRISGYGPIFVKCGAMVRYRISDVEAWVARKTVASTSEL